MPDPFAAVPGRDCNLVLIANRTVNHEPDFDRVCDYVRDYAPDVHPRLWYDGPYHLKKWALLARPTMVFSPVQLETFCPVRGRLFTGKPLSKGDEYHALTSAGVAVPRYRMLTRDDPRPDLGDLGRYVVVKPDRGGRGANIRVMKATKAHWEETDSRIAGHSEALIAQEFIYTGPWPTSYRVTTLFGEVIWALKVEAARTRTPMESADAFGKTGGQTVVSNSKGCVMSLMYDQDIIRFAEQAHRAFPDIPLLGVDVIRREPDGKLFVVEVNASGWVWHFSSPTGLRAQQEFGFRLEDQFDGLRKAARILADNARRHAA